MTIDTHFFSAKLAAEVGIEGATILGNLAYLQVQHEYAGNRAFEYEGRWYVRHSYESLQQWHPYLSIDQIRRIMGKLVADGYVVKSHLGKPFDRTLYWSVDVEIAHVAKSPDPRGEIAISDVAKSPDVQQTDNNRHITSSFDEFWSLYPRKVGKKPSLLRWKKMSDEDRQLALESVKSYPFGDDPKFIKHPTTWLNHECWNDESAAEPKQKWSGI